MKSVKGLAPLIIFLILTTSGCSGPPPPFSPGLRDTTVPDESPGDTSHSLLGLFSFVCDPEKGSVEVTPIRGAGMHLNALKFLEPPPYLHLTIENPPVFQGSIMEVDIGLRHPFADKPRFTGFDICGILITNGSVAGFSDPMLRMAGASDTRLLNPDGYTRWWNPSEFPVDGSMYGYIDGLLGVPDSIADYNSTINPYKLFCDDLPSPGSPVAGIDAESRCVFSAGGKNVRRYIIELGAGGLTFNYAVDASWAPPAGAPPWDIPDDFPPAANRPEAWDFSVTEIENTLYNDGVGSGGGLALSIDIRDHFNTELNRVYLESPGNFTPAGPFLPTGGGAGYSTYEAEITSATPASGAIDILIIAECEKIGYQDLIPEAPVAAYFIHTAQVGSISPSLKVLSIKPAFGSIDDYITGVEVTGTGFHPDAEVTL